MTQSKPPCRFIAAIAALLAMLVGRSHAASAGFASHQTYSGQTYTNQTIDVSGLFGVTFSNCTVAAIVFPGGCTDVTVDHCTFNGGGNLTACSGNVPIRFKFTNNKVIGAGEGVHWFGGPSGVASGTIDDNYFSGIARNPIEVQEVFTGLEIGRNYITAPTATVAAGGGMGISCATGAYFNKSGTAPIPPDSSGVYVHDNVIDQRGITNKGLAQIVGIEFMSGGGNCSHNYIVGCDTALVYCETGCFGLAWTANNNVFVACKNAMGAEASNNGYSTCTAPTNPTGNVIYASLTAAGCPPLPATAQAWAGIAPVTATTVTPTTTIPGLAATVTGDTTATLAGGTAGTLTIITTGNNATVATIPVVAGPIAIQNLHPGWRYTFTLNGAAAITLQTGNSTAAYSGAPKMITGVSYVNGILSKTMYSDGTAQ